MTSRIGNMAFPGLILTLALTGASSVWAQYNFLNISPGSQYGQGTVGGYGSFGGRGVSPYASGYNVNTGQLGAGYRSAAQFYQPIVRPQTTINFQPLYSAITALPGWSGSGSGSSYRVRRRLPRRTAQSSIPRAHLMDDNGTIRWPSTIPNDPSLAEARQAAEAAVRTVVHESKTTGHASIKPVIDAKKKLTAFAEKALPQVKIKNAADADALEAFFSQLGKTLDTMALYY
jgi:hypothetical protein